MVLAAALLLLWPAVLNRTPILFPDTVAYLSGGRMTVNLVGKKLFGIESAYKSVPTGPASASASAKPLPPGAPTWALNGGRSLFYGVAAWGARLVGGWNAIVFVQALAAAALLLAALRRLGLPGRAPRIGAIAVLSSATALGFFACVLLPDVFAGMVPLAVAMLVFHGSAMPRHERAGWAAALLVMLVFHKSFLALGVLAVAGAVLIGWRHLRREWGGAALAAAMLGLAAVAVIAVPIATLRAGKVVTLDPPFLLARVIADGPGARLLIDDCQVPGETPWIDCRIVPALPMTDMDFLWNDPDLAWARLTVPERQAIVAEQRPLVIAALRRYPAEQARVSLGNAARQFASLDLAEFAPNPKLAELMANGWLDTERAALLDSGIWRGDFSISALGRGWSLLSFAALALSAVMLLRRRRLMPGIDPRIVATAQLLLFALIANAVLNGVISGVYGRYQARVGWIPVFALIVLVANALRARRQLR